jgi:hypothetical protein
MQGRTAASGPLLRSAGLREFDALGSIGRPVIDSAPQLRATIRRQLGEDIAAMLAVPQINESGDAVDWYAPAGALVVPWSAATPEEREDMRTRMQAAREKVLAHGAALTEKLRARAAGNVADDFEIYARLLPFVMRIPDDSHIYAVDGQPVLTFWGFANPRHPEVDVIRDLAPAAAQAVPAAATAIPAAVSGRSWRWLWWLLLPLLALLLLLVFLRSCQPEVLPEALRPVLPDAAVPGVTTPTVPGVGVPVVPGGTVSGSVVPGGDDVGSAAVSPDVATSPQAEERQPDATPSSPQDDNSATTPPQPDNPASPPPGDKKAEEKKSDPATPPQPDTQPKGTPLVIPPQASAANDPKFLDGKWTSTSGLMDGRTGLPVTMEHEFKNGKGTTTIRRGDGTVCVGGSTAKMQGGKLVIVGDGDPKCSDGSHYGRPRVECRPGKDGRAVCSGKQAGGPDYSVDMRR